MGSSDELDAGTPARGPGTIGYYVTQSLVNAFRSFSGQPGMGDADADPREFAVKQFRDWEPLKGYGPNRQRLIALYDYYRDTYLKERSKFVTYDRLLWAGLGRMAGGAIIGGLDNVANPLARVPFSPPVSLDLLPLTTDQVDLLSPEQMADRGSQYVTGFLVIGKQIFFDLAWQHEAYLDEPLIALKLAKEYDGKPDVAAYIAHMAFRDYEQKLRTTTRANSYFDAWTKINSNDAKVIADGNHSLLQNEQFNLVQPVYDAMLTKTGHEPFRDASPFTTRIHPYHWDFSTRSGTATEWNILHRDDRWKWITEPGGMYDKWGVPHPDTGVTMEISTRQELVKVPMSQSIQHAWPVTQQNLIIGAP